MIDIFIGMSKRFVLTEEEKESIKKLYMIEQSEEKEDRKFCHGGNVKATVLCGCSSGLHE